MMLFRGRQPESSIWRRFRTAGDGFSFVQEEDYYAAHVVANAERTVDLFHTLMDVAMEDMRTRHKWKGESLALPDVREGVARLKAPLARFGGVEIAVYTGEDQLTLNPVLELFIYARTDQWLYILRGKGLEEQRSVRTKSWKVKREDFPHAPELERAIAAAAERLGLTTA